MQLSNAKIWKAFFFKSFVWLVMPICIFGNIKSCSSYIDAGHHLTPYSVSVRGYYRRDGTYVNPYKRRPPGGVRHDIPYENRRFYMGLLFFVCLVGNIVSLSVYTNLSTIEISRIKKEESEIEEKRIREEKRLLLDKIVENTDFNNLFKLPVPENLRKGISSKCKFCRKEISRRDYHVSFFAVSYEHHVCMNCVRSQESLGRSQPRSKYIKEIKFFENYQIAFSIFKSKVEEESKLKNFIISDYEIKDFFNEKLDTYERTKSEEPDETELSNSPIRKDPFSTGTITRIRVKSSNVFAIGYNKETDTLQVEFKNGSVYEYYEVPENVFVTFMNAESKGRFIRNLYRYKYREVYK